MQLDADGAPRDYQFVETNPAFEGATGLGNVRGRTALELVPGSTYAALVRRVCVPLGRRQTTAGGDR